MIQLILSMIKLTEINKNDRLYFGQKICIIYILLILHVATACSDEEQLQIAGKSPYISKIFEYKYAPGQHASIIGKDAKGNDFIGQPWINNKSFTALGGWGGYVIAGFDHRVENSPGNDFAVFTQPGPASEPGVVYVMEDANGDGLPNDGSWTELKGSEYNHSETIHNYSVTYYKPINNGNVTWADNQGNQGELVPIFDSSSWWWQGYGDKTEVTFSGVRLPNAYENNPGQDGTENWSIRSGLFSSGYAECYGNTDYNSSLKANLFDISNAVDGSGNPLVLTGIKFIKIQSGIFQIAGWLNEISTEISGAADLSLIGNATN